MTIQVLPRQPVFSLLQSLTSSVPSLVESLTFLLIICSKLSRLFCHAPQTFFPCLIPQPLTSLVFICYSSTFMAQCQYLLGFSGCFNKSPRTQWLKQHRFIISYFWRSRGLKLKLKLKIMLQFFVSGGSRRPREMKDMFTCHQKAHTSSFIQNSPKLETT